MNAFDEYVDQLKRIECADVINELNTFCILNKSTLMHFDSLWESLQVLIKSERVSPDILPEIRNALPVLSSINKEYNSLISSRVSPSYKNDILAFNNRIKQTTIDNCSDVLSELRELVTRNKDAAKVVTKQPAPRALAPPMSIPKTKTLNIVVNGYSGLLVNPATKLYLNGVLLGCFPIKQGFSTSVPLTSARVDIRIEGGLGVKRGGFCEAVNTDMDLYIEFNYNYFTGNYKYSFSHGS